jgi:septum site-determining protein MinC
LELLLLLKYKYDFKVDIQGVGISEADNVKVDQIKANALEAEEGLSKFVHGTLRSGQEIAFNGNIVVIGDVNPGAQLKAKGNIVVLGSLKGLAHAGIGGNTKAVVAAYSLLPTQLRIADLIVRPPEDDMQYKYPEIARIVNGEVVIEPYLPNK